MTRHAHLNHTSILRPIGELHVAVVALTMGGGKTDVFHIEDSTSGLQVSLTAEAAMRLHRDLGMAPGDLAERLVAAPAAPAPTDTLRGLYAFECPDCGYDQYSLGRLATSTTGICPHCTAEGDPEVWLRFRPATEADRAGLVVSPKASLRLDAHGPGGGE